ncbi:MAG: thrombospondin type 3 repeat-containing protein, partial [Pseudomonadales bacterium]|nr:thrombospondin type 3 repeat-containing protein [Pseudomonadales bacterium]
MRTVLSTLTLFCLLITHGVVVMADVGDEQITLSASKDTLLRPGLPNFNEGGNTNLTLGNGVPRKMLVGFDFSSIDITRVKEAHLILTIDDTIPRRNWGASGRMVEAHAMISDWSEGNGKRDLLYFWQRDRGDGPGATWRCAADTDISDRWLDCNKTWSGGEYVKTATDAVLHTNNISGEIDWNITQDVQLGRNSWALFRAGRRGKVSYFSREGAAAKGNPSLAPRLVLTLSETEVDPDSDGDGIPDIDDVFPDDPNENSDLDEDGTGDNSDLDRDGDGFPNDFEIINGSDASDASSTPVNNRIIYAEKDVYIQPINPNVNEGANTNLLLKGNASDRILAGFDMSGITVEDVAIAQLVLTIDEGVPSSSWGETGAYVELHSLSNNWIEGNGKLDNVVAEDATNGTDSGVTWSCEVDTDISNSSTDCVDQWDGGDFETFATDSILHIDNMTGEVKWDVAADIRSGKTAWLFSKETLASQIEYYSNEGAFSVGQSSIAPRIEIVLYDQDGDSIIDRLDVCPDTPAGEAVNEEGCSTSQLDSDNDGVTDNIDECPDTPEGQIVDSVGCISDRDGDGVPDAEDSFPDDPTEWADLDSDGIGDSADTDRDGDGISNDYEAQVGTDPDDSTSTPPDLDGDGIPNTLDSDRDGDGVDNTTDAFPDDASESSDLDNDGIGDNADTDRDGDGYSNTDETTVGTDPNDPASVP